MPTRVQKGLTCTWEWYKTISEAMTALKNFKGDAYRDSLKDSPDGFCITKLD